MKQLTQTKLAFPNKDISGEYMSTLEGFINEGIDLGLTVNDKRLSGKVELYNSLSAAANKAEEARRQLDARNKYNALTPDIQQSTGLTPGQFNPYETSTDGRYVRYGDRTNPLGPRPVYNGTVYATPDQRVSGLPFNDATMDISTGRTRMMPTVDQKKLDEDSKNIAEGIKHLQEINTNTSDTAKASREQISATLASLGQGTSLGEMASGLMSQIAVKGFTGAMSGWIEQSDKNNGLAPWLKSKLFGKDGKPSKALTAISSLYTGYEGMKEGGALGGAMSGAQAGFTLGGPPGAAIGALAGLFIGGSEASKRAQQRAEYLQEQQLEQLRKLNNAIVPVSDYFRSTGLNNLPGSATFGSGNLATSYAVQSSRGVR
jgi:hypothetical protein